MSDEQHGKDPSRQILAKRHQKSSPFVQIHRYTSLKTGERLSGEGHNEHDFWLWSDTRPNVRAMVTELDSISIGRSRYTPDVARQLDDNRIEYIEVKSDRAADKPKFQESFARKIDYFRAHGHELKLVRRSDFPCKTHMLNLKLLYIYKTGTPPTKVEMATLKASIAPGETRSFGELFRALTAQKMTPHAIWFGLSTGLLSTDMQRRITDFSMIKRRKSS